MSHTFMQGMPEKPKKKDTLIGEEMEKDFEVLYVDTDNDSSFSLNSTASAILEMCNGERSCQDISDLICETIGGDATQVYRDTESVLEEFYAHDLIA